MEFKKQEAAEATKIKHSEEQSRAMETNVSDSIQELEVKMKEMKKPAETTVARKWLMKKVL